MRNVYKLCLAPVVITFGLLLPIFAWSATPAWVKGDAAEYPSEQYLLGRGVGSTEEEAQNRARGDLVTIFEVRIKVANENVTTVKQSGKHEQVSKFASQRVSAKTDKVISGVSIAKLWRDPQDKDYHALAVLSRSKAAAALRDELRKIDAGVQQQIDASNATSDSLLKIAALSRALQASIKRDGFQASLQVVSPSGHGVEADVSQTTIQLSLNDVLKRIRIAANVADDGGVEEFSALLNGGLAAAGFLANATSDADLVLVGKLKLRDLGRRANWNWMRATVEVSLVEKASGRVRGSKTWSVKASAQDVTTARIRTLYKVEKLFDQKLRKAIIGFAAS